MLYLFKRGFWDNALKDEMTWLALAVDVAPVIMVVFFGWRAEALVLLYWAENIIIGVGTLVRIVLSGVRDRSGAGVFLAIFMAPFFLVHYGLFCFGHGVFVFDFAKSVDFDMNGLGFIPFTVGRMFEAVRLAFPGMTFMLGLIALYQITAAIKDYWPEPGKIYSTPGEEMFAPYGRIMTLHIAIIFGAGLLMAVGDPMSGVFLLIILRMAVSVIGRAWRDKKLNAEN